MSSVMAVYLLATGGIVIGCTGLGYWIGSSRQPPADKQTPRHAHDSEPWGRETEQRLLSAIEECISSSRQLGNDCQALQLVARVQEYASSAHLANQIDRLFDGLSSLTAQLHEAIQLKEASLITDECASKSSAASSDKACGKLAWQLSNGERSVPSGPRNAWLTADDLVVHSIGNDRSPQVSPTVDAAIGHRYECDQFIAPWDFNDPIPHPADFVRVKCRDISRGGISFMIPDPPDFTTLLITVGTNGHSMIMAAKVVHSHSVFMFGNFGYLIACEFVKRMSGHPLADPSWQDW